MAAATRRVREELGVTIGNVADAGVFTYRAVDPLSGLVEYEQDHVYAAVADTSAAVANPDEISELVSLPFRDAAALVESRAGTPWAAEVLRRAVNVLQGQPAREPSARPT